MSDDDYDYLRDRVGELSKEIYRLKYVVGTLIVGRRVTVGDSYRWVTGPCPGGVGVVASVDAAGLKVRLDDGREVERELEEVHELCC
jgi:hypothetical protein